MLMNKVKSLQNIVCLHDLNEFVGNKIIKYFLHILFARKQNPYLFQSSISMMILYEYNLGKG